MTYLSENPWPLAGALGLLGLGFLIALRVTQQGTYLVRALAALGLALAVLGIERVWVTDAERVEATVLGLARAVEAGDAEATASYLAPEVVLMERDHTLVEGPAAILLMRGFVPRAKFDFLRVSHLEAHAGAQSRQGAATFRASAMGTLDRRNLSDLNFAATDTSWSLGLRETEPGVWKVTRISATRLPRGTSLSGVIR